MPHSATGSPSSDPFEQAHLAARELARRTKSERHDTVVVLGSGLSAAAPLLGADAAPVDLSTLPWFPRFTGIGHRTEAWSVTLGSSRVLLIAGRSHLYEGLTEHQAAHTVRTAIAGGCHAVILTCAAGSLRPELTVGSVVAVSDHLNLTGRSPLLGVAADDPAGSPFVDLADAWSPRLRALVREIEPSVPEGVYAQLPGPHFETPAEIRMLAGLGADLVGMSIATEAIAARHLGAEVLGLAVVTNPAAGLADAPLSVAEMIDAASGASPRLARLIRRVAEQLGP
ncbi:MAG TPA: purine-nucleoside phosphorylase [Acidimicrobiales bacterium]|nr:purine-nucleoside phosphorylase [Acidimicrobiales bacterium]